jgi:hypothetical protein
MLFSILPALLLSPLAWKVGVVGAQGGLGRELVEQCVARQWECVAFVRRPYDPILTPARRGWLEPRDELCRPRNMDLITVRDVRCDGAADCNALVFAMSGKPFMKDDSTKVMEHILGTTLPNGRCTKVVLVSAHGVGDSAKEDELGISVMRNWYLRSAYEEKEHQERLIGSLSCHTLVLRPKVLSYDTIPFNKDATRRKDLSETIMRWASPP